MKIALGIEHETDQARPVGLNGLPLAGGPAMEESPSQQERGAWGRQQVSHFQVQLLHSSWVHSRRVPPVLVGGQSCQMPRTFCSTASALIVGRTPGPQPTSPSACAMGMEVISLYRSGTRGTRADLGRTWGSAPQLLPDSQLREKYVALGNPARSR